MIEKMSKSAVILGLFSIVLVTLTAQAIAGSVRDAVTILSPEDGGLQWTMVAAVLMGLIGCVMSFWISRVIFINKYKVLSHMMALVGDGRLDVDVPLHRNDVFGSAFDDMVKIVRRINELKDKAVCAENAAKEAQEAARMAHVQASAARTQGEIARCQGLLSAAETLEMALQSIRDHSFQLDSSAATAREGATRQQQFIAGAASAMEQMNGAVSKTAVNAEAAVFQRRAGHGTGQVGR